MSPLERLGLEVSAYNLLGSRGQSSLLLALLEAGGATVPFVSLKQARAWRMPHFEDASGHKGLIVRVSRLREALSDVGLGDPVVTHQAGYALPEPARSAVLSRLIAEAA